jgi:hypothetical protein
MENLMKHLSSAVFALALAFAVPASATTLSNGPGSSGNIASFGADGASTTYGQVFTAPVTGTMTSFTMWLNGGVGEISGSVGTWNGTSGHGFDFGSPTNLFTSAATASGTGGGFTFSPNVSVTAGSLYVAFLSVFGLNLFGSTSMPLSDTDTPGINYFVWNNNDSPFGDS